MKSIKTFAFLFAILFIAQSCRKESDEILTTPPFTEPIIIITGSVLGTVLDDNGNAVESAVVTFEDISVFTDEFGVFQFKNESLYSSGTYIKVTKDGFFDGSRRFYPSSGKTSMITIELIPQTEIGEFNSTNGSKITFENVELDFTANSIMNEDGSAYLGNVNVAAKYLDPTVLNTLNQMPGDLTGTTVDQNRVVLTSMAMIAVELFDDNGSTLQVQDGKTVDVKIPVPSSLVNDAPSIIPMWYFDEEFGTWIEEGSAVLVNGMYQTSLSHFTFWNCDIPNELVFLKGSIVNRGIPIQGVNVKVAISSGGTSASTITDANGFFCGYVPKHEDLTIDVFDQCGNVIFSINIPASEVDIFLEPFNLTIETNVATITGTVVLCGGTPSAQTYISASQGALNNIIVINDDFTFAANIFYCSNDAELLVRAVDPVNVLSSGVYSYTIDGNIDVGEIELCETDGQLIDTRDGQKYLTVEINGMIWTAENMRFDTDDAIPDGNDLVFNSVPEHYGRLYNYYSAQAACPTGWHLPSEEEFDELVSSLGPSVPGLALKSSEDWLNNGNGSNSSGFNAFPVGIEVFGDLDYTGKSTSFWSSKMFPFGTGIGMGLDADNNDVTVSSSSLFLGFSVRCIKD